MPRVAVIHGPMVRLPVGAPEANYPMRKHLWDSTVLAQLWAWGPVSTGLNRLKKPFVPSLLRSRQAAGRLRLLVELGKASAGARQAPCGLRSLLLVEFGEELFAAFENVAVGSIVVVGPPRVVDVAIKQLADFAFWIAAK